MLFLWFQNVFDAQNRVQAAISAHLERIFFSHSLQGSIPLWWIAERFQQEIDGRAEPSARTHRLSAVMEGDQVIELQADADRLAHGVVVVARHLRQHTLA